MKDSNKKLTKKTTKLLAGAALALTLTAPVKADTHGCTVLLCLASTTINPMSIPECVADLVQFWWDIAHFNGYPSCPEAGGAGGFNPRVEYFPPCPAGYTALPAGVYVDGSTINQNFLWLPPTTVTSYGSSSTVNAGGMEVCGAGHMGQTMYLDGSGSWATGDAYYYLLQLPPNPHFMFMDVLINNAVVNTVSW